MPEAIAPINHIYDAVQAIVNNDTSYTFPFNEVMATTKLNTPYQDGISLLSRVAPDLALAGVDIYNTPDTRRQMRELLLINRQMPKILGAIQDSRSENAKRIMESLAPILTNHILKENEACPSAIAYTHSIQELMPELIPPEVSDFLEAGDQSVYIPTEILSLISEDGGLRNYIPISYIPISMEILEQQKARNIRDKNLTTIAMLASALFASCGGVIVTQSNELPLDVFGLTVIAIGVGTTIMTANARKAVNRRQDGIETTHAFFAGINSNQ